MLQINTTGSLVNCWHCLTDGKITTADRVGAASSQLMAAVGAAPTLLELHHKELHNTDDVCSLM
jgi:hypothetical protein